MVDPTLDVKLNPVNPMLSEGETTPTEEVALTPVGTIVASITKLKEPTLEVEFTPVRDIIEVKSKLNPPTLEVAETPDG